MDNCLNLEPKEDHGYCADCEACYLHTLRIMNLVNEDANPKVSVLSLQELFEKVLIPLLDSYNFELFCKDAGGAHENWLEKFKKDHKKVMSQPDDIKVAMYDF